MTRRVVIFQGKDGWFVTPEFNGDKSEFEHFCLGDTCDENWTTIAARFSRAKTLQEFREANMWAQGLYHSRFGQSNPEPVVQLAFGSTTPDETMVVYEDLGVTGFSTEYFCHNCNCTHTFTYKPDGRLSAPSFRCYCGALIAPNPYQPSAAAWEEAVQVYRSAAWTYQLKHEASTCVDVCKIPAFDEHGFRFEVTLFNGDARTVSRNELERVLP